MRRRLSTAPEIIVRSDLALRRHQRHDVALDAELRIAPAAQEKVRLAPAHGGPHGPVKAVLVDASMNGLGFMTTTFIPRLTPLRVLVRRPTDPSAQPLLDMEALVQRVTMTDRRPGYLLGASASAGEQDRLERFIALLADESGEHSGGGARA